MKNKEMRFIVVLMLVILGCIVLMWAERESQSELYVEAGMGEQCEGERLGRSKDVEGRYSWKTGVGEWQSKGRPYRNPLRRYKVGKKVRRALRSRLARLAEKGEGLGGYGEQGKCGWNEKGMLLAVVRDESARWG